MTRRELYQSVSDMLSENGDARLLLAACAARMRTLRGLPCSSKPLPSDRLDIILRQDDALGQIYQAINAPRLQRAYREAKRDRRKFTSHEIPAVTQLFTPRRVIEFLLHNTLGQMWKQMHPDSRIELPALAQSIETGADNIPARAIEIRVLDPACGTMNFGLVAADLLEQMYREELDRAGRRGWPATPSVASVEQIPGAIARHNLFGIDIDTTALDLAAATLRMKLRLPARRAVLNLIHADALFDPNVEHRFAGTCDIVVTNPPYLSARNLSKAIVKRMKSAYPASCRDTGTCFIERCLQFTLDGGRAGILVMHTFMFTGSFETLREKLNQTTAIEAIAHFGGGLFDVGNPGTLQTAAVVLRREPAAQRPANQTVAALRLIGRADKEAQLGRRRDVYSIRQDQMLASPRHAWIYWHTPREIRIFSTLPRLADVALPRQGLATTDNARFVRFWWEVEPTAHHSPARATPGKWVAYTKSGRFRRWYEAPRHRVDWLDDGCAIKQSIVERYPYLNGKWEWVAKNTAFYGRGGVTYSYLTSGQFSARRLEAGGIFDVAGSALFPDDPLTMLGVLNSSTARRLLGAINPTVNFQVGDLAQLPVPRSGSAELRQLVSQAIEIQRTLDTFDETTTDFISPMPWKAAEEIWHDLHRRLAKVETRVDRAVASIYQIRPEPDPPPAQPFDRTELARRWGSCAVRRMLVDGPVQVQPIPSGVLDRFRAILHEMCVEAADEIVSSLGGLETFLRRDFFGWHAKLYQKRPPIWKLESAGRAVLVAHDRADRRAMTRIMRELRSRLPDGWDRFVDDGIAVNLVPLRHCVTEPLMSRFLQGIAENLDDGRLRWSRTWQTTRSPPRGRLSRAPSRAAASALHQPSRAPACSRDVEPARR